jgi:hypothetical protein
MASVPGPIDVLADGPLEALDDVEADLAFKQKPRDRPGEAGGADK